MSSVSGSIASSEVRPNLRRAHDLLILASVVGAYFLAAQLGFKNAFVAEQVTTVWAPSGIAMATLLVWGVRFWPAVWLGALLANALTAAPLWTAFFIATGNTLEAAVAAVALRRLRGAALSFDRVGDVLAFLLVAAVGCSALAATTGVTTLSLAGVQPWHQFPRLWFEWWFGDLLGALLVTPALLPILRQRWTRAEVWQTLGFTAGAMLVTYVVFRLRANPLEYAIFPIVIGAAATAGAATTALVVLGAAVVAVWHTLQGAGPFASPELHDGLILLQIFIGVLAATALLLSATIAERRTSESRERNAATMLRLAQRAGGVATFEWDFTRQVAHCSAEFFTIFGLPAHDGVMTGARWGEFVHPDDRAAMGRHLARALEGSEPAAADYRIVRADGTTRWLTYAGQVQRTPAGDRMLGTVADITSRKNADAALQRAKVDAEEGQRRLAAANRELARQVREQETLLDVLPVGIGITTDPECRHIRTNRAFAEALGLPRDANASLTAAAEERPAFRVLTPQGVEVPPDQLPMQTAARTGVEIRDLELDVVHPDGRTVRLLEYAAPLMDEAGKPRGAIGAFVDITPTHQARLGLARSEERYRRIFETAGVSLWEADFMAVATALDGLQARGVSDIAAHVAGDPAFVEACVRLVRVVDVNPATLAMFNAPDRSVLLGVPTRLFRPETHAVFAGALVALAQGARNYEAEARVEAVDGRHRDVIVHIAFPARGEPLDRVLISLTDISDRKRAELVLREAVDVQNTLAVVGASLARELHGDRLIQAVTDASTRLTEAEFGAFFHNIPDPSGESYSLYALSGAPREAFARFPHLRATQIFGPTFRGESTIRLPDVTADPRYGKNPPFHGMPEGHLPVRSYLAVPVIGRGGIVLGGLFFGHSQADVFTERHQRLAEGVAGWAAIALDNAHLYEQAAEANRLKDEFLATLSHELRTPLNAVLGWAHMLRQGGMEASMSHRAVEAIERNARVQAQLIEDLLDVSRIMSGKLQIRAEPVDLAIVVTNAVDTVRAGLEAKGLTLTVTVPTAGSAVVTGDPDRLQQVVWNLVSNAVKFTPSGGQVDVEVRSREGHAEIEVRDTGQGISPSFRPHLFERFRQMDPSKTRQHGGLGLGLSIVRHLVEAHGGSVGVESEGINRGSTFRVRLPLRASAPRRP